MKKLLLLSLISFFSCVKSEPVVFLGKDARKETVWKELLQQERVKFYDVKKAYKTYKKHNDVIRNDHKIFERWENLNKDKLDAKGYVITDAQTLAEFYKATPNKNKLKAVKSFFADNGDQVPFSIPNSTSNGNWVCVGPFGNPEVHWSATGNGASEEVIFHPTNAAIMYLPTRGAGLWKTTNYGTNWVCLTDHFEATGASCAAISKSNPDVLYFGTFGNQLWKSVDAGITWTNVNTGQDDWVLDIEVHPNDPDKIVVANRGGGLMYSHNGGETWAQAIAGEFQEVIMSEDGNILYSFNRVSRTNYNNASPVVLKSVDFGVTWTSHEVTTDIENIDFLHLSLFEDSITDNTTLFVYGIAQSSNSGYPTNFIGLWKSEDQATTFNRITNENYTYPDGPVPLKETEGVLEEYVDSYGGVNPFHITEWASSFYVSPLNKENMLTQSEKMYGSQNGGKTWEYKPSYGESHWADLRYLDMNITKDSIYFCNDGGVWAIADKDMFPLDSDIPVGTTRISYMSSKVVAKNGDISLQEGTQMDVSLVNKDVFITGGQDIGQTFTRHGRDSHVASADVYRGRMNPSNDAEFITGQLEITINGATDYLYDAIQADHFNPERIYGFTKSTLKLVRSKEDINAWETDNFSNENLANSGGGSVVSSHQDSWEVVDLSSTSISNAVANTFEQSRANKDIAFIGDQTNNKVFKTINLSDANPSWIPLGNAPEAGRYRFATHPNNENLVAMATESQVYLSRDGGISWSTLGILPINSPNFILFDKDTSQGLYVSNTTTVVYNDESLTDWVFFNKGLPNMRIRDMRIAHYANNDNQLYVTKYGRGVWRSSLYSQIEKELPTSNFVIHGNSSATIVAGESVQLLDLSSEAESISWTLSNGIDIVQVGNENMPHITLSVPGFYTVTQTVTNSFGSDTLTKQAYVNVAENHVFCEGSQEDNIWYRKFTEMTFASNETIPFSEAKQYNEIQGVTNVNVNESIPINLKMWDVNTWYYIKGWVDFNNDGVFDEISEEVFSSGAQVNENFDATIIIPSTANQNETLKCRIIGLVSSEAPTPCTNSGTHQMIDMYVLSKTAVEFTATTASVEDANTANVSTTYANAEGVVNRGFVYSKYESMPTIDSAEKTIETTVVTNSSFINELTNLDSNTSYYYRAFVITAGGIIYDANVHRFTTPIYNMPMLVGTGMDNLGNNEWKFNGTVIAEGNLFDSLVIEYGVGDTYDQIETIDVNAVTPNEGYKVGFSTVLSDDPIYNFRLKGVLGDQTFYSQPLEVNQNQEICIPTVSYNNWFKRIDYFTIDETTIDVGSEDYQDYTSTIVNVEAGKEYAFNIYDNYPGFNAPYLVYLDVNNDNDFGDNGELIMSIPASDSFTGTITIPENTVTNAEIRMRTIIYYGGGNLPCSIEGGQVIDYTLKASAPILSIEDVKEESTLFSIYPNPVSAMLNISYKDIKPIKNVTIYSTKGDVVYSSDTQVSEVSVAHLSRGIYLVTVIDENNNRHVKKMIKN